MHTCKQTLIIDPLEEAIHRHLIQALYKTGRQKEAINHYKQVTEQFYDELGIGPSGAMQQLFYTISRTTKAETGIEELQQDLKETIEPEGAFYCEYEVFKNLYRLEARTAARTGKAMFVCMLSATTFSGDMLPSQLQPKVMGTLKDVVHRSLRKGDVYSRFSPTQLALLLPTGTYENCELVVGRILKNFRRTYRSNNATVHAKIVPLEPVG